MTCRSSHELCPFFTGYFDIDQPVCARTELVFGHRVIQVVEFLVILYFAILVGTYLFLLIPTFVLMILGREFRDHEIFCHS